MNYVIPEKNQFSAIYHLAQKPVLERLAEVILMLKDYYGYGESDNILDITITREEIANIAGTSTESAIRLLTEMKKKGIIDFEGKKIKILKKEDLIQPAKLCV